LLAAPDEVVLERARSEDRILISADSDFDFGTILATSHARTPSVLYLRGASGRRVEELVERISAALALAEGALREGSLVVVDVGGHGGRAMT